MKMTKWVAALALSALMLAVIVLSFPPIGILPAWSTFAIAPLAWPLMNLFYEIFP